MELATFPEHKKQRALQHDSLSMVRRSPRRNAGRWNHSCNAHAHEARMTKTKPRIVCPVLATTLVAIPDGTRQLRRCARVVPAFSPRDSRQYC